LKFLDLAIFSTVFKKMQNAVVIITIAATFALFSPQLPEVFNN